MREQNYNFVWNGQPMSLGYLEWGASDNPKTLVCVHGLTRNSHDFDFLAETLSADYRVLSIDVAGRGRSAWLDDKMQYHIGTYAAHIIQFLMQQNIQSVDWIGTSMGGLTAMMANTLNPSLIRKLILNDVGPHLPQLSLQRIRAYASQRPKFMHLEHAKGYFKKNYLAFGITDERHWDHLAKYSTRPDPTDSNGGLILHYDPDIAVPFQQAAEKGDLDLWPLWDGIQCPTLVIRGKTSDVLPPQTLQRMLQKGGFVETVEIENAGHAPALMDKDQIAMIKNWLGK